mmetsp:Transcript_37827/g.33415  ORF Transcript_37827/g.33415 Transcript_37827/m.33415 type:complete len:175 (+) Transcript_37827:93-617(+)|eukprot:CAMPEP_0201566226 /NCGR_PEP_ID=MMETSP0190_2-20130828/5867_1 /ASSEMBLY_ACC=CAM_ASM_000263 /TAXON_ID=37353 /ORGANISM="Rosalina sp." /LENGTH=174 /DNA_ID=CAMNT_0047984659 /DNA_START=89 /DNA_END=613 /DNA_ORIENTATION=-
MSLFAVIISAFLYQAYANLMGSVILDQASGTSLMVSIDTSKNMVEIDLAGDGRYWFGVGFNSTDMNNTYTILVDGGNDAGKIYEYKLGSGTCSPKCDKMLTSTTKTNSNSLDGSVRTINVTRSVTGSNGDYYTFPTSPTTISLIWGVGNAKNSVFESSTDMGGGGITSLTFVSA